MQPNITLYGIRFTRSARCRWTLQELGLKFEEIDCGSMIGGEQLREFHPHAKVPAIVIDDEVLFESAAICTYLCDLNPGKELIASPGTRARALHDQWVSFGLSELEGYLWSTANHTGFYPQEKRVGAIVPSNTEELLKAATVLNDVFADEEYLIGGEFSVSDIILGWSINWARRMGYLDDFPHLQSYVARLLQREHCALNPE
jgi:glutathione S-transferase